VTRLAAAFLLAASGLSCTSEVYDPMERQPRYGAYRESALFDDGRAMRTPPAGTVSREAAKDLLAAPPVTRALLEEGRHHFDVICATCHGLLGDGDSLVARNMALRPPPNLNKLKGYKRDEEVYLVITQGFGLMAGYAAELTARERWAVIGYLRALQRSQTARLEQAPPEEQERLRKESP
jgi:mono/diheme cytochrome c family protein